ncbi:MAG TPA: hypothetical protein VL326_19995 [Kofleriaceae bacterium]|jgi:hypothetical protein|nr:hypothetical protein [Kofleriaceae bacterium]
MPAPARALQPDSAMLAVLLAFALPITKVAYVTTGIALGLLADLAVLARPRNA